MPDASTFGPFRLDTRRHLLLRDGQPIPLGSRALHILCELVAADGALISKDELMARVWPNSVVEENNLHVHVSALRKALGDRPDGRTWVQTVPGRGYRFCAMLDGPNLPLGSALPEKPSIAILPFSNLSGEPDHEYFTDGMVEDITTALSRFKQLFVITRNSSFAYKGKEIDITKVGTDLGVRYVLEGSVRKSGNKVRITCQLIAAQNGMQVWSERYDRELKDIFALQDEIAKSVACVLEPALSQEEQNRALRKPPASLDAWEAYQRGMWHFNKYAAEENIEAQTFFRQAIQIDARFAPGYYGWAFAQHLDCWLYAVKPWEELAGAPLKQAQTAVRLDPEDSGAHAVLCALKLAVGDWDAAVREGQLAADLNPNSGWSLFSLGNALGWSGAHWEGVANLKQAIRMSPRDPMVWLWRFWIGIFLYFARDYEAALASMREVSSFRPGLANRWITACLGQLDRPGEARDALCEALSISLPLFEKFTRSRPPWMRTEDHEHMLMGLRKAGYEVTETR